MKGIDHSELYSRDRKISVFFSREKNNFPREKTWKKWPWKKMCPWKKTKNPLKLAVKQNFYPWKSIKNDIFGSQIWDFEKNWISASKTVKLIPVKKIEKSGRENKSGREKSQKRAKLWAWNENIAREKCRKKCQNWLSRALLSFTGKKKHWFRPSKC